jgi:hypothetical protein
MTRKTRPIAPASVAAAASAYADARAAFDAAEAAKKAAASELLQALQAADLTAAETPNGVASIVAGRRTVKVTCPALKAEITAMQERAVRTGRAVESVGSPSVRLS